MSDHTWEVRNGDAPGIGEYSYSECTGCGATARHRCFDVREPIFGAFLAGEDLDDLSMDCNEARRQIALYRATPKRLGDVHDVDGKEVLVEQGGTLDPKYVRIAGTLCLGRRGAQNMISALKLALKRMKR